MTASIDAEIDNDPDAENDLDTQGMADQWRSLIEALVPPTKAMVEDVTGVEHQLRCMLPATVEIRLIGLLEAILELPVVAGHADRIVAAKRGSEGVSAVLKAITGVASEPEVLKVLSDAFRLAHPKATREAAINVAADQDLMAMLDVKSDQLEPQHMFSVSDILGGIVPFGVRAVAKGRLTALGYTTRQT